MSAKVALTGIKPTGTPHLGNYLGAIRPALELARQFDAYYFIANYHALNSITDPEKMRRYTLEVAATWLSLGLDPERVTIYRQSDLRETFELFAALVNVAPKGLLNRAHAYKAQVARNQEEKRDPDDDVNMGLFNYPVLMAADILLLSADFVPVGRDQAQHVEIARDLAQTFNRIYGDVLKVPGLHLSDSPAVPGIDGRKMSKSYGNTVPLFSVGPDEQRKLIRRYKTDSAPANAPKDADASPLYQIYRQLAPAEEAARVRDELISGAMTWGALKDLLFERLDAFLKEPRVTYQRLMSNPQEVDRILREGSDRARPRAVALMDKVRQATGAVMA